MLGWADEGKAAFRAVVTSDLTGPTAGVLGLMGISAATGLGAAVIDSGKRSNQEGEQEGLEQKKKNDEQESSAHVSRPCWFVQDSL